MSTKHITITDLHYVLPDEEILIGMNQTFPSTERVGIVGRNGAGKTTFLQLLTKKIAPTSGSIEYHGTITFAHVEQIPANAPHTVFAELESAFQNLKDIESSMGELEEQMAAGNTHNDILEEYGDLQHQYSALGGYTYHNAIHQVLLGLGIPERLWEQPLELLSGGERTKVSLAKVLLAKPDMMILDEPTNFLDMDAVEWLEYYLVHKWKGGLIVVSHDRRFLDKVTTSTLEIIKARSPEHYPFSYSKYSTEREKRIAVQWKHFRKQDEELARQEEIVRRLKAGSRASLAQSRMKMIEKTERILPPKQEPTPRFSFKKSEDSAEMVLELQDMMIGHNEDTPLYHIDHLILRKGEKVGILGPNGAGKTTLLKTIMKSIAPLDGSMFFGKNLKMGYYAQTLNHLNPEESVLEEMFTFAKDFTREQVRSYMGSFLFKGDEIHKKIKALSGGERARVALAKLSLTYTNVLILDEPTNHLDYWAREALEDALSRYHGTVLFISHDRYFIDKMATHLWVIENESVRLHYGNYTEYIEAKGTGQFQFTSPAQEAGEQLLGDLEKYDSIDELEKVQNKWKNKKRK